MPLDAAITICANTAPFSLFILKYSTKSSLPLVSYLPCFLAGKAEGVFKVFLSSTIGMCYREGLIRAHHLGLFSESISLFGHQTLLPLPLSLPLGQLLQVTFHLQQPPRLLLHLSSQFLHLSPMLVVRRGSGWMVELSPLPLTGEGMIRDKILRFVVHKSQLR